MPRKKQTPNQVTDLSTGVPPGEQLDAPDAQPLRGEEAVDASLVAEAVQHINGVHNEKGLETAREIGEYLFARFFAGSFEAFRSKGKKHASFRALAEHPDLTVSHTTLWYSVAVLDQLRQLPADIGGALPMSHHRLLLPVKDEQAKLELAREAVQAKLGKRELEERIRQAKQIESTDGPRPGRPPLPSWAKSMGSIQRAVNAAAADPIEDHDVATQGTDRIAQRLAEVDAAMERLAQFRVVLAAALERGAPTGV